MSERKRRYARRSRVQWSRLMAEYEASDVTQREFCAEHGVTYGTFCRWRKQLHGGPSDSPAVEPLIELPDLSALTSGAGPWRAELDLGNGIVLRLR